MSSKKEMPDFAQMLSALAGKLPNSNEPLKWWSHFEYPEPFSFGIDKLLNFARMSMFFQAVQGLGGHVIDQTTGYCTFTGSITEVISSFEKLNGKLVYHTFDCIDDRNQLLISYDNGLVYIDQRNHDQIDVNQNKIQFYFVCSNKNLFEKLEELAKNFYVS